MKAACFFAIHYDEFSIGIKYITKPEKSFVAISLTIFSLGIVWSSHERSI